MLPGPFRYEPWAMHAGLLVRHSIMIERHTFRILMATTVLAFAALLIIHVREVRAQALDSSIATCLNDIDHKEKCLSDLVEGVAKSDGLEAGFNAMAKA